MRICWHGFLGDNHSWAFCAQNLSRALIKQGHTVDLCSTNGYAHFPNDLKPYIKQNLDNNYDMQLSYTAMKNFPHLLSHGKSNRFGIWNYETTVLPQGFAKYYQFTDKMLPSSEFSRQVFLENGIPDSHMVVVPHGINLEDFSTTVKYPLKTNKRIKILANIAQPHIRKNIPGLLNSFGKAFTSSDNVCLVLKIVIKNKIDKVFEVDFNRLYSDFRKTYPNHAEVELVTEFIPNIAELYNACDVVFSMTYAECFWLPGIESIAAGKITIAPRWGGQLDFMNDSNSLLISGKKIPAPKSMQYWSSSPYAAMFEPNVNDAVAKLRLAYENYDELLKNFAPVMQQTKEKFTWSAAANQIIGLCK